MLVNRVMSHGKKSLAYKIVYKLWNLLLKNTTRSIEVLEQAIKKCKTFS
jgi:ribosomal protein S7